MGLQYYLYFFRVRCSLFVFYVLCVWVCSFIYMICRICLICSFKFSWRHQSPVTDCVSKSFSRFLFLIECHATVFVLFFSSSSYLSSFIFIIVQVFKWQWTRRWRQKSTFSKIIHKAYIFPFTEVLASVKCV